MKFSIMSDMTQCWRARVSRICGNGISNMTASIKCLLLIFILTLAMPAFPQTPPANSQSDCGSDTVDSTGPETARGARAFLAKLKAAVQANDKKAVASMVHYPLKFNTSKKNSLIEDRKQFLRQYSRIMDAAVRSKIVDDKSSRCLFANWQGFMIGDGEVWFQESSPGLFEIITVNANDQGSSPESAPKMKFETGGMGELEPKPGDNGVSFSLMGFVAPDGHVATYEYGSFASPARARQKFDQEISKASVLRTRTAIRDESGTIVGQRAEIISLTDTPRKTAPSIIWTVGSTFYEIISSSSQDNLALERNVRGGN
jgi:hypothetical protein